MNAENLRQTLVVHLGSPTALATLTALFATCDLRIKKLALMNDTAITASGTNYAKVDLKRADDTIVATIDTQSGLSALQGKSIKVADANQAVLAGVTLKAVYTPVGTQASAALANAKLQIEYVRAQNN